MPPVSLPDGASLAQLRKQAKDLRDLARAGVPGAVDIVAEYHPKGAHPVTLTGAQLVVARHNGFASWARLEQHLEMIERYRRSPDEVDQTSGAVADFLAFACLRFGGDDEPSRWERAARVLAAHPGLTRSSIHVTAAAADEASVRAQLAAEPALACHEGGPYGWVPLLYLASARHDPRISAEATLGTARALLEHGADPNTGYLWHGLYPPYTAATCALGSHDEDEHPHAFALAELLLTAGADANDGQLLYNRQFGRDDRHLVLLLEHGLGRGDGGPWAARFGAKADSPREMLRGQLWWAIVHDRRDRVALLVEHGADVRTPYAAPGGRPTALRNSDGLTPAELAMLSGYPELAGWLVAHGAARPALDETNALIAAVLAGDRDTAARLRAYAPAARERRPGLMAWAAAGRKLDGLALLAELGFDVNARGRLDIPLEQQWFTPLHEAAQSGDVEMARLLLRLGADPNVSSEWGATPLESARQHGQDAVAELLEPLTGTDRARPRRATPPTDTS
ncbi:MAG TPA: ankyrin repeat domain-containing protein [Streptosporangiaceae bacterium]|nr:ankyrin repeat domain-containing protein [Streptosporangiaceae bacterium]